MPPGPQEHLDQPPSLQRVVDDLGLYPIDAFLFVQEGLTYTTERVHPSDSPDKTNRHVTGQQLSEGLREYAIHKWGMLASTVLRRWGITRTYDFGKIVWAMVETGYLGRTEGDSLEDFRDVFDFRTAFEPYSISCKSLNL